MIDFVINDNIHYEAKDSMHFDVSNHKVLLYGDALIQGIKEVDTKSNFKESALPQIKKYVGDVSQLNHIFEQSDESSMKCCPRDLFALSWYLEIVFVRLSNFTLPLDTKVNKCRPPKVTQITPCHKF